MAGAEGGALVREVVDMNAEAAEPEPAAVADPQAGRRRLATEAARAVQESSKKLKPCQGITALEGSPNCAASLIILIVTLDCWIYARPRPRVSTQKDLPRFLPRGEEDSERRSAARNLWTWNSTELFSTAQGTVEGC